jgi:hypothetical protein
VGRALIVDGRLVGYGVLRAARDGYRVGPLFADSRVFAEVILDALVAGVGGVKGSAAGTGRITVAIDVPETNGEGLAMVGALGLEPSFEVARMYTGPVRDIDHGKVFGVTTLELG